MCTSQFTEALIPDVGTGRVSDPVGRQNRTGAVARPSAGGTFGRLARQSRDKQGRERDTAILRRAGLSQKDADQLARFANTRGGLDAFDNIAAARKAFRDSGAFTDRAGQPRATRQVSRIGATAPINQNRVGAADLIGLPLIRTGS